MRARGCSRWRASALLAAVLGVSIVACGHRPAQRPSSGEPAALPAPQATPGSLEVRPLLGDVPLRAARLGAGPLTIVATGPMIEGERLGAFVDVPKDVCLLAYGRSSPSLEDIDLAAFAEEGNPLAVDEGPDPRPTILLCPPHPDRVYVAAHAASGEGLCVIGAQFVPRDRAPEVARAVAARGALGGPARTPEAWPGLDDQVRAHRAAIGATWEEARRVAVAADARATAAVPFSVDEGTCADAVVVPDEDVALLDVEVVDGEGRVVARARDGTRTRFVTVCSPMAFVGSLQIRPHVGRGLVAVVIGKAKGDAVRELRTRSEVIWAAPIQPVEVTRAARNLALAKAGYGPPTATTNGQLSLGRRVTIPVDLSSAGCTRVDVVAGAPLALVEASAWDDSGALLGAADGVDGATLFACGKGKARIDLASRGRPGPYSVLVRPEIWRDAAFAAHPLAAGRLLLRAATGQASLHEGALVSVRHATIDASRQYTQSTTVPPGRCLGVAVGVEGEGTGIEIRVVDATTGEELDRSSGQNVASVRACSASGGSRSVRLEARCSAGKLEALFAERLGP